METTFGECTDNEKKETVISDCSEMRTEGTSRPSGLVGTARDDHLPVSIPGVIILKISSLAMAFSHAKSMFSGSYSRLGNAIANRSRLYVTFFPVDSHPEFGAPGPKL